MLTSLPASTTTIGAHTINHANLAVLDQDEARAQIKGSKQQLETLLGHMVEHFAYPYGGRAYASVREFRIASEAGFAAAVTCPQGFLFGGHSAFLTALPRLIIGTGAIRDQRLLGLYESGIESMKENRGRWFVTD